jgi:hypothetical protein
LKIDLHGQLPRRVGKKCFFGLFDIGLLLRSSFDTPVMSLSNGSGRTGDGLDSFFLTQNQVFCILSAN